MLCDLYRFQAISKTLIKLYCRISCAPHHRTDFSCGDIYSQAWTFNQDQYWLLSTRVRLTPTVIPTSPSKGRETVSARHVTHVVSGVHPETVIDPKRGAATKRQVCDGHPVCAAAGLMVAAATTAARRTFLAEKSMMKNLGGCFSGNALDDNTDQTLLALAKRSGRR